MNVLPTGASPTGDRREKAADRGAPGMGGGTGGGDGGPVPRKFFSV